MEVDEAAAGRPEKKPADVWERRRQACHVIESRAQSPSRDAPERAPASSVPVGELLFEVSETVRNLVDDAGAEMFFAPPRDGVQGLPEAARLPPVVDDEAAAGAFDIIGDGGTWAVLRMLSPEPNPMGAVVLEEWHFGGAGEGEAACGSHSGGWLPVRSVRNACGAHR